MNKNLSLPNSEDEEDVEAEQCGLSQTDQPPLDLGHQQVAAVAALQK